MISRKKILSRSLEFEIHHVSKQTLISLFKLEIEQLRSDPEYRGTHIDSSFGYLLAHMAKYADQLEK